MLYILLFLTLLLLATTLWYYRKWRKALSTKSSIEKQSTTPLLLKEETDQIINPTEESFVSILEAYTKSLESIHPLFHFIQYHEHSLVSIANPHISDIKALLQSIITFLKDNELASGQILLHSRLKENQLLLRLQLPPITSDQLKEIITDDLIRTYNTETAAESEHSTIKMWLPTTKTAIAKTKVNPVVSTVPSASSSHIIEEIHQQLDTDDSAILIIEDNEEIADFIATCIPRKYKTFICNNGKSGADKAFELIPDLIISDIMMPQLDGLELCDLLKNDIRTEHIPIILLTAKVTDQDKIEGLKHGADAYLTKPFDETELQLRIDNLLSLRDKIRKKQSISNQKPATNELFIAALRNQLEANYTLDEYGVQHLADSLHMSRMQLHRKVKSTLNLSTSEVLNEFRLEKAIVLIKNSNKRISEIAYDVGFSDAGYFSKVFKLKYGLSPRQIRDK